VIDATSHVIDASEIHFQTEDGQIVDPRQQHLYVIQPVNPDFPRQNIKRQFFVTFFPREKNKFRGKFKGELFFITFSSENQILLKIKILRNFPGNLWGKVIFHNFFSA
jgi:hypothetical protein